MAKFARINPNGNVHELVEIEDHIDPKTLDLPGYPLVKLKKDSKVQERWVWDGKTFSPPREDIISLSNFLTRLRKDKIFIGCEFKGALVECTQESIASMMALRDAMRDKHLPDKVTFKATTAYIHVTENDMDEMLKKARRYLQQAFDMEAECLNLIRSGEIKTISQVKDFMEGKMPTPRHLFLPRDERNRMMPAPDLRNEPDQNEE